MSRKSIGILTVFLLFGLVAGWYYFTNESKYFNTSAFKAVPPNSSIIVRVKNISAFSSKASRNFIFKEFSSFPGVSFFSGELHLIDSLFQNNPVAEKYLSEKDVLLSYGATQGKMSLIYLVELSDMAEKTTIKNLVRDYFSKRKASFINQKKGEVSEDIYYWSSGPSRTTFCISFYKGVFIAGTDPDRVLEAAGQLDQKISLPENPKFQKVFKTSSPNADLNIYINRQNFGKTVGPLVRGSFFQRINNVSNKESWTELDFSFKESELFFNGLTLPSDSLGDYQRILLHQSPANFDLDKHLPAETSFFLCLNLQNPAAYFNDYEASLTKKGELESYKSSLNETDTLYGVNLQSLVKTSLNRQAGVFFTHYNDSVPLENRYFIMKINNESHQDSLMLKLVRPMVPGKRSIYKGMMQEFKMGQDVAFKMYQIPVSNFGERVFGKIFSGVPTSYFTICDSCIIMGGSYKALEEYLRSLNLKETLNKNPLYSEFVSGLSQPLSLYLWGKPGYCLPFFHSDINSGLYSKLENQQDKLRKIHSFGWLMAAEKGMIYNLGRFAYSPVIRNKPVTIWKFKTDSAGIIRSQFVFGPQVKEEPEVIAQDKNYNLYLINSRGALKWKNKLSHPILSEIFQVNGYKDKRIHFLFNTADAIYMMDEEGNHSPGFPVHLQSKATNGIGVFDYDKTFDYRIFVACEDRNIYAFDRHGIPITGWQPSPSDNPVSRPVQFFRVLGKDYIVYSDRDKTYIMDRKGNQRISLQQEFSHSPNNGFTLEPSIARNPSRLVTTDEEGTICTVSFDGSVKKLRIGKFSPQHFFLDEDLNDDNQREYIFLDGNTLTVYNSNGKTIFSKNYLNKIDVSPEIILIPGKGKKLGIVDRKQNQIYFYNPDGSDYEGFPVEGNSVFSFGAFNSVNHRFNLLAATPDGYLNNYSLK